MLDTLEVLYAVIAKLASGEVLYARNGRKQLMVYATFGQATGAAKQRLRTLQRGLRNPGVVSLRVVGVSAESDLATLWDDYEHTDVG